jgi:hypothetical protein
MDDARLLAAVEGTPLGRSTLDVHIARSVPEILRLSNELLPEAVVMGDSESFPGALEACRRIRSTAITAGIPVIYVGVGLDVARFHHAGVTAFVPAPATRLEIRRALAEVLRLPERVARRRRVDLPVTLELGGTRIEGRCRDLSLSGAFMTLGSKASNGELRVGEEGTVAFTVADRPLALRSRVVRQGPGAQAQVGVGLSFLGVEASTSVLLSRYCRGEAS